MIDNLVVGGWADPAGVDGLWGCVGWAGGSFGGVDGWVSE